MAQSVFISYGGLDVDFVTQLNDAIEKAGIQTWFFEKHAKFGDLLHRVMREGVNKHDRTLLVCSKFSLTRSGVMNEIEELLRREAREGGGSRLIPIALDDYIYSGAPPDPSSNLGAVRAHVVAKFFDDVTGRYDPTTFDENVKRIVAVLR